MFLVFLPLTIYLTLVLLFYGPLFIVAQWRQVLFFAGIMTALCSVLVYIVTSVSDQSEFSDGQREISMVIVLIIAPILMLAINKSSWNKPPSL